MKNGVAKTMCHFLHNIMIVDFSASESPKIDSTEKKKYRKREKESEVKTERNLEIMLIICCVARMFLI